MAVSGRLAEVDDAVLQHLILEAPVVWLGRVRLKRHSRIAPMHRRTPDMQPLLLVGEDAKEALVKEFVSRDRLNRLRDAVGYRVSGALLGEYWSLNLIVRGEPGGSDFDLAKETSLSLVNTLFSPAPGTLE
jgi:hypothetical protein